MDEDVLALLIPIFGIVFSISFAAVAIVINHREKLKRAELRHRERMAALEKGMELPPEPAVDVDSQRTGSLRRGLSGIFVGIVLYFALGAVANEDVALFGLIPAAIGAANLIGWLVDSRRKA